MKGTLLAAQVAAQRRRGDVPAAIFTDLDGTFVVDGNDIAGQAAEAVRQRADAAEWPLIAVSGRDMPRLLREVAAEELPPFSALVGAVGTEIYLRVGNTYKSDQQYAALLAKKYDREQVLATLPTALASFPARYAATPQTGKPYEPFKVSFWFHLADPAQINEVLAITQRFYPQHKLIASDGIIYNALHSKAKTRRYNMDIVPASKSDALQYLMRTYGIERGIVAGDSGNDIDALLVPGLVAVLVGGHQPEARNGLLAAHPHLPLGTFHTAGPDKHILIDTHPARLGPESILLAIDFLEQKG